MLLQLYRHSLTYFAYDDKIQVKSNAPVVGKLRLKLKGKINKKILCRKPSANDVLQF